MTQIEQSERERLVHLSQIEVFTFRGKRVHIYGYLEPLAQIAVLLPRNEVRYRRDDELGWVEWDIVARVAQQPEHTFTEDQILPYLNS